MGLSVTREEVREALRLAGHGLHPDCAVTLAMIYLDVQPLPGSEARVTAEARDRALDQLRITQEVHARQGRIRYIPCPHENPDTGQSCRRARYHPPPHTY